MRVAGLMGLGVAEENDEHESEHVKRRQHRYENTNTEQNIIMLFVGLTENGVFAVETAQERKSRQRERAYHERPIGGTHFLAKRAHVPDVLLMVHAEDHRT